MVKVFVSEEHDPWWNQAFENQLYENLDEDDQGLYLWRNQPSVVIGRFQNPWMECNLPLMKEQQIGLVRRRSGGGTVFHDLGNLNFSFLMGKKFFDKRKNLQVVQQALHSLGAEIEINARHDLILQGKKISGSAFKESSKKCYHHGTLLIRADLSNLRKYLLPTNTDIITKAIPSVRSSVINLCDFYPDLTEGKIIRALTKSFAESSRQNSVIEMKTVAKSLDPLSEEVERWKDPQWCLQETPLFQRFLVKDFTWGKVKGEISVIKGKIQKLSLDGEGFRPSLENFCQRLEGVPYSHQKIYEIWKNFEADRLSVGQIIKPNLETLEVGRWLLQELTIF